MHSSSALVVPQTHSWIASHSIQVSFKVNLNNHIINTQHAVPHLSRYCDVRFICPAIKREMLPLQQDHHTSTVENNVVHIFFITPHLMYLAATLSFQPYSNNAKISAEVHVTKGFMTTEERSTQYFLNRNYSSTSCFRIVQWWHDNSQRRVCLSSLLCWWFFCHSLCSFGGGGGGRDSSPGVSRLLLRPLFRVSEDRSWRFLGYTLT